ncbi:hypothetical protein [Flavobacterium macacae]|uniref:Outer membrane protein beta-barrel domain-containing protein n=1 Tax=Flavobacterium macacae TaxID=2488993 RepID=A0A3P3WES1_9FLAO|nr:hypothetical protein [Flavobacterium macacae]RRJ92149.1 hypothetical protein EG849_06955 [Flavobacterium macacae]
MMKKPTVYFKNMSFKDPSLVKFKFNEDSDFQLLKVDDIIEFGIEGDSKFIKKKVNIDESLNYESYSKDPIFISKVLFLNVIVEGPCNLYSHYDGNKTRFFYQVGEGTEIVQLIYKKFHLNETNVIKENNEFRNQLNTILKCDELTFNDFIKLKYVRNDIEKIVQRFNLCQGKSSKVFGEKTEKIKFKYSVFALANQSNFSVYYNYEDSEKLTKTNFGGGAEIAMVFSYGKSEVFFRGDLEQYSGSSKHIGNQNNPVNERSDFTLESTFLNFNLGYRHNFFISSKNKIFLDASMGYSTPSGDIKYNLRYPNGTGQYLTETFLFEISNSFFLNFGVGYVFNDKFGIEIRKDTNRDLLLNSDKATFSRVSLGLKYTIN